MTAATTIVDWSALGKVVLFAMAGGVGLTLAFSLALYGLVRAGDRHREERHVPAAAYGALAFVGALACVAALILGLQVMLNH